MLKIVEHSSSKYTPRTYHNAKTADLTAAFAVDFTTAGEKCTHKAAGDAYVALPLTQDWLESARWLYIATKSLKEPVLNIAGNGIYTLAKHGWTQEQVNQYVYDVLKKVHAYRHFKTIISGGQTGVDIAGIVAAVALGIPAEAMLPKGFIQRYEDKVDRGYTEQQIRERIMTQVRGLEIYD
jgi:hypothetical protein